MMGGSKQAAKRPEGIGAFAVIWSSQILSILTSGMSGFALTIWMYERTGSATAMTAVQVSYIVPFLVMSFFAGPMIDRYNRRLMMAVSDVCAAIGTVAILCAFLGDFMQVWMIYATTALMGIGNSFQWPAFSATTSLMVPKEQLGRINGMMSLMDAGPAVFAPIAAGALLPFLGIKGILAMDIATFALAVGALFLVEIPQPARTKEGAKAAGNIFKEAAWGFRYIFERPSLLGLQLLFFAGNLFAGLGGALFAPMILTRSGGDSLALGGIQTAAALGGVAGGILMGAWGGFKKRTWGVLSGWLVTGLVGGLIFGLGRSFWTWAITLAISSIAMPVVNGSNQAIWQSKVAPDMQGRVFSARRLIAWFATPLTPLIAGPLADFVLEPPMRDPHSLLASILGPAFGVGPGAGMAVIVSASGILVFIAVLAAWSVPAVRRAEELLPDHDQQAKSARAGSGEAEIPSGKDTGQAGEVGPS